jgi:hypothetical protein
MAPNRLKTSLWRPVHSSENRYSGIGARDYLQMRAWSQLLR